MQVIAVGSFKKGSINLEKIRIVSLARPVITRPPLCPACNKRMTSDGKGKGYKCKKCGARSDAAGCAGNSPYAGAGMV